MKPYTEDQHSDAWKACYADFRQAEEEVRRLKLVQECIHRVQQGERPFTHTYTTESHHNGSEYRTSDIVWAKAKPVAHDEDSVYTVLDMPEYDEAIRRLEAAAGRTT